MTGTTKPSGIPWIGEIPVDWETDEIRYKFKQVKSSNFRGDEDNLLSLSYGRIIQKDIESAFGLLPESFDTYNIIENGDIVLRLTDLQNDQKSLRVGFSEQCGIITSAYLALRLASEGHAKFFYYLIHAYDLQKVFYGMGAGVRQGLNWDELKRLSVLMPNIVEQQAIADFLDEECVKIDAIVADMEKQVEILKAYKKTVITETITKGLDKSVSLKDSGVAWIGAIPKHWQRSKVKYCVSIIGSGTTPDSGNFAYYDGDFNWIQSGDVYGVEKIIETEKTITKFAVQSTQALKFYTKNFLVVAMYGASVGNAAISTIDAYANQACCCIKPDKENDLRYMYYFFVLCKEPLLQKAIGGTQPNISQIIIKNESYLKVPLDEQQAIADYLDEKCAKIDAIINDKQAASDTMCEYKKSLIYEYVTGKKRVKEAQ